MMAEIIEAVVILVVVATFYAATFRFSDPLLTMEGIPSPAAIPRLILILLASSALIRLWIAIQQRDGVKVSLQSPVRVLVTACLALAYPIVAAWLGMLLPVPFFCLVLAWLWGGRAWRPVTAMAASLPLFIWIFFELIFKAQLPLWPWS